MSGEQSRQSEIKITALEKDIEHLKDMHRNIMLLLSSNTLINAVILIGLIITVFSK